MSGTSWYPSWFCCFFQCWRSNLRPGACQESTLSLSYILLNATFWCELSTTLQIKNWLLKCSMKKIVILLKINFILKAALPSFSICFFSSLPSSSFETIAYILTLWKRVLLFLPGGFNNKHPTSLFKICSSACKFLSGSPRVQKHWRWKRQPRPEEFF